MCKTLISRPRADLTAADIIRMHAKGVEVPMTEYTVTHLEGEQKPPRCEQFPENYNPRA